MSSREISSSDVSSQQPETVQRVILIFGSSRKLIERQYKWSGERDIPSPITEKQSEKRKIKNRKKENIPAEKLLAAVTLKDRAEIREELLFVTKCTPELHNNGTSIGSC